MEPVSIGLLVAYIIIIAIALERSYRVHSLKLKCAVSDKNMEDLAHDHRAFIILHTTEIRCAYEWAWGHLVRMQDAKQRGCRCPCSS